MKNYLRDRTPHIFSYDNSADYTYLKQLFMKANTEFLLKDYELLETDVAETTLCSALKSRLEKYLADYNIFDYYVDLEYCDCYPEWRKRLKDIDFTAGVKSGRIG